jgi:hypothetical protein
VLVVVDVMPRVAMVAVDVVEVILVGDRGVPAAVLVDVHVPGVRQVTVRNVDDLVDVVHVVLVDMVDVAIVQEVDVVLVGDRGVPAVAIVRVRVLLQRVVRGGLGHRNLRGPR